ncbi:hypothetical protein, partial [Novosphingobium sp. ERN07]|uniref:hypothetical protein n=1 Tax=Novosphingobium sp. ERN07 TaxID=2726187 RepID=UPI001F0E30F3
KQAAWVHQTSPSNAPNESQQRPQREEFLRVSISIEDMRFGFLRCRFGRIDDQQTMLDQDSSSEADDTGRCRARGWRQRAEDSMMVMCPPQHRKGGR